MSQNIFIRNTDDFASAIIDLARTVLGYILLSILTCANWNIVLGHPKESSLFSLSSTLNYDRRKLFILACMCRMLKLHILNINCHFEMTNFLSNGCFRENQNVKYNTKPKMYRTITNFFISINANIHYFVNGISFSFSILPIHIHTKMFVKIHFGYYRNFNGT